MSAFDDNVQVPDWAKDQADITDAGGEEVIAVDNIDEEPTPDQPTPEPEPDEAAAATEAAPVEAEATTEPVTEPAAQEIPPGEAVDWEKRYGDLRRQDQQRAADLQRVGEENKQLNAALTQVVPYLQQMASQRRQPSEEELAKAGIDPELYKQVKPLIEQEVDARSRALQAQMQQSQSQQQVQAEQQAVARTVDDFLTRNAIEKGSEQDMKLGTFIQELNRVSDAVGLAPLDLTDSSLFDIALEASNSDTFRDLLLANPHYIDDDARVALARKQAAILDGVTPGATTQPSEMKASQPLPHVTRGAGGGSPSKGSPRSDDPLADAKALVAEERASVF